MAVVKLVAFADNDAKKDAQAVNQAMIKEQADVYCFVGDGPYSKDGVEWTEIMGESFNDKKDKLMMSRGNHDTKASEDWKTQEDIAAWYGNGLSPRGNWLMSRQVGNVYIISMDTEDLDREFKDREQFIFVTTELAKAKQLRSAGQIDWIVMLAHKPFFTLKSSHSPYTGLRFMYKDAMRDAQVDFMIHGHNHNTQLWKPMIPNQSDANTAGEPLSSRAADEKTFDFTKDHGAAYIVTGHAGHEWNPINDQKNDNVLWYGDGNVGTKKFGFTSIEFDGKKAHVMSKDTDNQVVFEYHVTRDSGILGELNVTGTTGVLAGDINNSSGGLAGDINNSSGGLAGDINNSSGGLAGDINNSSGSLPTANAGADKAVGPESTVMLNGSKSYGGVRNFLFFMWSQIDNGPIVTLDSSDVSNPFFIAPALAAGVDAIPLVFQLQVTDHKGSKSTATVNITVKRDVPPSPSGGLAGDINNNPSGGLAGDINNNPSGGLAGDINNNPSGGLAGDINNNPSGGLAGDINNTSLSSPSAGEVLWDSNIYLKTGQKYTITDTYGDLKPNGKGVLMAASGNPKVIVDPDGTFHLEADAGHGRVYIKAINFNAMMEGECMFEDENIRNTTWRLRSRHNEGGNNENKFGGFGATCERAEQLAEYATEPYHNEHENDIKKPLEKHLEIGKWFKFRYYCFNSPDNKEVLFKTEYDYLDGNGWVQVLEGKHPNPKPYYMDKVLYDKESYAWLRINNEKTGKVAYRNVKIIKI